MPLQDFKSSAVAWLASLISHCEGSFQGLVESDAVNVEQLRHAGNGLLSTINHLAGMCDFLRCEVGGPSQMLAAPAGGFDPCAAAFRIQAALELRQCAHDELYLATAEKVSDRRAQANAWMPIRA
jgi:hypothetical protein